MHTQLLRDGIIAVPPQVWANKDADVSDLDGLPNEEQVLMNRLGFIFLAYRVDYWWWESVEMFRKFLMSKWHP